MGPAGRKHARRGSSRVTLSLLLLLSLFLPGLCLAAGEREVPAEAYVAGDAVTIQIWADTGSFFNGTYPIDGAGMADLPITGRIVVAGKSRPNIEKYLGEVWAPYLKDTHVRAIPAIRVGVVGNVRESGFHYAHPDAVVWDVIKLAGGPVDPEKLEKTSLVRGEEVLDNDFIEAVAAGKTLREAGVRSGDRIVLPPVPARVSSREVWRDYAQIGATLAGALLQAMTLYIIIQNQ